MSLESEGLQEQIQFLQEWPISRLKKMTLDEYTNLDRDSSFTYWLEKKTEHSGSIWGGSAFKFGIYRRADLSTIQEYSNRLTDGVYAWFSKYGATPQEAFQSVRDIVTTIAEYSENGRFDAIDPIDFGESMKWKIAFHYNPNQLIPIFKREMLIRAAEQTGMDDARKRLTSELQSYLVKNKPPEQSTLEYASTFWSQFNSENFYCLIDKFLQQAQTDNLKKQGFPRMYQGLSVKVSFGAGNSARIPWIAFLKEPNTVSNGIYPVYLYYKGINTLILAYGLSETDIPRNSWNNNTEQVSIKDWFLKEHQSLPERYGSSLVKSIYRLDEELDPALIQTDLDAIIAEYKSLQFVEDTTDRTSGGNKPKKYWLLAAGEQGSKWEEFYKDGIIALGWNRLHDLNKYDERDEIAVQLRNLYPEKDTSQRNNSLALWQFSREMQLGDIVIIKEGTSRYLGYGVITSDYFYDTSKTNFSHLRRVDWKAKGEWNELIGQVVHKTLTEITKYPEYVDRLKRLIGIEQDVVIPEKINFWWVNFNPKYWQLMDLQPGSIVDYRTRNAKGDKKKNYTYFENVCTDDLVIAVETSPVNSAIAVFEIARGLHLDEDDGEEKISLKLQEFLPNTPRIDQLLALSAMQQSEILNYQNVSICRLQASEFDAIIGFNTFRETSPYTIEEALSEIFIEKDDLEIIKSRLRFKKNVILQGPPGTGKTFMAKRLAYLMLEEKDETKVEMIQFHQSLSYEDFMQGYKPNGSGTFQLENGVFYRFCKKAMSDPGNDYFFIIDEINRGNLSKIFGELMLLLEADKRGEKHAVTLTYGNSNQPKFYIPNNLFLIGTMNTADRSLAVVDYALRRRFAFINVNPSFTDGFKNELINNGVDEGIVQKIVERVSELNKTIIDDSSLGDGFTIGHSYFCNFTEGNGDSTWYEFIIKHEIEPLVKEYWFDSPTVYQQQISRLLM